MQITRGVQRQAQRVVIYGPEGIGKTTLASRFPRPVFVDTEGSTGQLDVARTPVPTSWAMLKQILAELVRDHRAEFDTLVIDTADWAETMCIESVCAEHGKSGVEEFGYGKGFTFVMEEWGRFLNHLSDLRTKGLNIVLLAHAHMRKFEQPDEAGAYDRWELKLTKKCAPLVKEWADMVLFCNYYTLVTEIDGKKKAQGGHRVMYTTHHPCWDAKNRHGLEDRLALDYDSIAHCIPTIEAAPPVQQVAPPAPAEAPTLDVPAIMENLAQDYAEPQAPIPAPDPVPAAPAPMPEQPAAVEMPNTPLAQLAGLMASNGVTDPEIQAAVAAQGYYPIDTPLTVYDSDFVASLVASWDGLYNAIQNKRKENAA